MSHQFPSDQQTAGIEYIDGLYSYALLLTRNRADAEDLVQETYVRAIRAIGHLRDGSNVKNWLFTILRNTWLNEVRHRRAGPQTVDLEPDLGTMSATARNAQNPHDALLSDLERHSVRQAIQQLPTEAREIILLRECEDLSYQEIAQTLDCPVGTVMSRLARARSKLKTLLSPMLEKGSSSQSPASRAGDSYEADPLCAGSLGASATEVPE